MKGACVLSCVWLFSTPRTVARQAPLSRGFPRQGYWSGLPFPSPGDLPNPGIELASLALAGRFFTTEPRGKSETQGMHRPITSEQMKTGQWDLVGLDARLRHRAWSDRQGRWGEVGCTLEKRTRPRWALRSGARKRASGDLCANSGQRHSVQPEDWQRACREWAAPQMPVKLNETSRPKRSDRSVFFLSFWHAPNAHFRH